MRTRSPQGSSCTMVSPMAGPGLCGASPLPAGLGPPPAQPHGRGRGEQQAAKTAVACPAIGMWSGALLGLGDPGCMSRGQELTPCPPCRPDGVRAGDMDADPTGLLGARTGSRATASASSRRHASSRASLWSFWRGSQTHRTLQSGGGVGTCLSRRWQRLEARKPGHTRSPPASSASPCCVARTQPPVPLWRW